MFRYLTIRDGVNSKTDGLVDFMCDDGWVRTHMMLGLSPIHRPLEPHQWNA